MIRVEIIGPATLILGDAREIAHEIACQAVITDPVWPNCPPGLLAGHEDPAGLFRSVMDRVDAPRASVILRSDSDPRFLAAMPMRWPFVCVQALSYAVPMYVGRVLGGTEMAYGFGRPIPVSKGRRVIPMWGPKAQPRDRLANGHPCSRALVHMEWLVGWWSVPGETVFDPFMGSGTTGVAAVRHGRRFVGCEIDPGYFDVALRRLEAEARTPHLTEATA